MKAQSRRNAIMEVLQKEEQPISASTLAKRCRGCGAAACGGGRIFPLRQRDTCWPGTEAEFSGRLSVFTVESRWEKNYISVWITDAVYWT